MISPESMSTEIMTIRLGRGDGGSAADEGAANITISAMRKVKPVAAGICRLFHIRNWLPQQQQRRTAERGLPLGSCRRSRTPDRPHLYPLGAPRRLILGHASARE